MGNPTDQPEFEQLPDLYQRWARQLLPSGIPRERESTCDNCAMGAGCGGGLNTEAGCFDTSLKCCTYFPDLPNFLVGRALANDNPGAAALREIVEGRDPRGGATLRVVHPDAKYSTIYTHHSNEGFGRDPSLLCPFAIEKDSPAGPRCGVWMQRNAVCTTYFCKHVRGRTGARFWQAFQGLLMRLEWALSWWAIAQVLDRPEQAFVMSSVQVNDPNRFTLRKDAWELWPGSRAAFYEACAERVEALPVDEAIAIGGFDARLGQLELEARFGDLISGVLPERLRAMPFATLKPGRQRATLQAMNCTEPFEAPAALIPLLSHFDGRPTAETLESIRQETQVRLDPNLVRRLYDFGILESVPEAPTA